MKTVDPLDGAPELCKMNSDELAAAFRSGGLSPVEVVQAAIDRAEAINSDLNAFTFLDHRGAMAAARQSEKRWREQAPKSPVDGVPTTLKDIVWARGWPTRYGSATSAATPREEDAPSVANLRDAGVVFIGQTTTPEFGWKAVTDSPLCGITRNPWNRTKTAGGSSGGAAVAAATGAGVLHLGTDGGGSIRIPASFTGIAGLKPTYGRIPAYPASVFGTVAHIGPMARKVSDVAAMLNAMAGRDNRDWWQGVGTLPALQKLREFQLAGRRIGYWSRPAAGKVDPRIDIAVSTFVNELASQGASVEPFELPTDDALDIFCNHWFAGAAARMREVPVEDREILDPGFVEIAGIGSRYSAADLAQAQTRRSAYGAAMDRLLERFDFVISPATSLVAFDAGLEFPAGQGFSRWVEWAGFSFPINLSQQPACVLPCGHVENGLPFGLQIVGARGDDSGVLAAASSVEKVLRRLEG